MLPSALVRFLCGWYKEGVERDGGCAHLPRPKKDIEARHEASEQRGLPQTCLQNEMGGEHWGA